MKDNKQFIQEIYDKYEEYKKEQKNLKNKNIKTNNKNNILIKVTSIAAIFIIVFTIFIAEFNTHNTNSKVAIENDESNNNEQEETISLATIDNFENFYNMLKPKATQNDYQKNEATKSEQLENLQDSVTNSEKRDNYSKTNTQDENVDEADIVKTDGKYIYYVSESKISIIDLESPENLKEISKIEFNEEFKASEIYIVDNILIAMGNSINLSTYIKSTNIMEDIAYAPDYKTKSIAVFYDLNNIKNPKEIRRIEIEGNYNTSRVIGKNLYFVTNKYISLSSLAKTGIEELKEEDYKPTYRDTIISNEDKKIDFSDIYYFNDIENTNYLILTGVNLENLEEADIKTFLGAGENVYASAKNMYITKEQTTYEPSSYEILDTNTRILKFKLNNGKIKFKTETQIEGIINNQFSMDESNGYFKIATTVGNPWILSEKTSNSLFIFDENLNQVGKIEGLARGEKIYSVRYTNNKAYIVTLKQVDPLFVIDLTDPANPTILGELKIPGYSTYLHPYDETHIIGFGYDTKEDGTRITTNGLKMAMFDISDLNNPKELFKVNIGDKYTSSELIYNHKALLYSKEKNLIAFPIVNYKNSKSEYKAQIYQIDLQKGFILKGEIEHNNSSYENLIKRIIYIDENFYTLSNNLIKVTDMNTLKEKGKIELKNN